MAGKDYIAIAAQYQADVLNGIIPACKWVRLACERNRRDLDRQETDSFPYRFDPSAGVRICQMAEMLPHVKGPKAFIVGSDDEDRPIWNPIALEPWQCWFLCTLFGWKHSDGSIDANGVSRAGLRRFRVSLALIPRKNAKSTLAAIVVLYMLVADGESGAECYSAATTRDQAKAIAEIAWEMAKRSPLFREHFGVRMGSETTRSLTVPANGSKFMPLSADAHTLDSLNVSLAAIDELHAHRTAAVWNVLDTATGARLQPMIFAITTAGVDIAGVCHQKLAYLHKILDRTHVDESFFGVNYTIDVGDDIRDRTVQRKANPNWGVSVNPDDLERKVHAAFLSPSDLNDKLTKHFNVWIRTESGWMTATDWQACTRKPAWTLDELKGYPCWIGVDLGEVKDFSAVPLLFKLPDDVYALIARIYVPQAALQASPVAGLEGWARTGEVIVTPGNEADYQRIEDDLVGFFDTLDVKEIDFDRRSARLMIQKIKQRLEPKLGRDEVDRRVIDVPQSLEIMDPAMKTAERLVVTKKLQHDGNEAMAWMVGNIVVERNHKDEMYPRKAGGKDSHNKIDGPVAFFCALLQAMQAAKQEPEYRVFFVGSKR